MAKPFSDLYDKMPPESKASVEACVQATLQQLVSFEVYERVVIQLNELCHAAQAVLDGKALQVDSAGDRYVIDQTLRELEAVLTRIQSSE